MRTVQKMIEVGWRKSSRGSADHHSDIEMP
jgi:hypothetical protein